MPPAIPPTPAPEIRVTPARAPCSLPALPQPFKFIGYPDTSGDRIFVTKSDLSELGGYLVAIRGWIAAASACLEADK